MTLYIGFQSADSLERAETIRSWMSQFGYSSYTLPTSLKDLQELGPSDAVIFPITPDNAADPLLLFQAGAVWRSGAKLLVYLLEVDFAALPSVLQNIAVPIRPGVEGTLRLLLEAELPEPSGERATLMWSSLRSRLRGEPEAMARLVSPLNIAPIEGRVQFTAYFPYELSVENWNTVLFFAHLRGLLEQVQTEAKRQLNLVYPHYELVSQETIQPVRQGQTLMVYPMMENVEFNPLYRSFRWEEAVHREEFRCRAISPLTRQIQGSIRVFMGPLLVADLPIHAVLGLATAPGSLASEGTQYCGYSGEPYRRIFPSYSHKDVWLVRYFQIAVSALGDTYLQDVISLRSGEAWSERIKKLIATADVFQLFWSWNSITSEYVRDEWCYGLELRRQAFIRPVYWEKPMPRIPEQNLPPPELERLQFSFLDIESLLGSHG